MFKIQIETNQRTVYRCAAPLESVHFLAEERIIGTPLLSLVEE
jgi:hypothetical protein